MQPRRPLVRMCDAILASPGSTAKRIMLFGKNSDRERNEAQAIEHFQGADHAADAQVACTYIRIPQARRTHAVLISRPFWMWGAETGANEWGVAIGNEGLHARTVASSEPALTGMDLVRLALERSTTAAEAVDVITKLLERHGQGGNCGHMTRTFYNNGFLVADATEAFVIETLDREWLIERVSGVRSLSNVYSIGRNPARFSAGLLETIRRHGWTDEVSPDFAAAITHPHREHIGQAGSRRARSTSLLGSRAGQLGAPDMMRILRDHGPTGPLNVSWHPELAADTTLCMHAGGEDRPGQTVGSWISQLGATGAVHWVTG